MNSTDSVKYSAEEIKNLVDDAGFYSPGKWTDKTQRYDLHLFQIPPFKLERAKGYKSEDILKGVPSIEEYEEMWKAV